MCDRKPANTSIIRAASRRASADSDSQAGTSGSCRDSSASGRHDAELPLPGEDPLPVGVPAFVELARVAVGPLLRHMVRRVRGARAVVQIERLVRGNLGGVGEELDGPVGQVGVEVVALLRRRGRLDLVVVVDQVGIPLAGVAAQEPVEPLEPPAQRPAVERPDRGLELRGQQVVLADHVRAVPAGPAASRTGTRSRTGSGRCSPGSRWRAR